ncbi:MAG: peptidoglycan bridge formation glycyltransferase FemA/FemB family protein, partial [Patescibacteria group bacterium]|nr:peptidoglycan bridge formation glycyltransferase FemA/FemB family protein [Patescibacteria group bacterium]
WEAFLANSFSVDYPFFQGWNWGEVQKKLSIPVTRIGYYQGSTLIGVLQLVEIKAKRGHYLYIRHGPLLKEYNPELLTYILTEVKIYAKRVGASFIRISRFPKKEEAAAFFMKKGFIRSALQTSDAEVCWVLDITKSEEDLLKDMRKSHRYLIKKSQTMPITISKTKNQGELEFFLPLYKKLSLRKHFVAHKGVIEEFEIFAKDNEEQLFLAKYNEKIIAGAMIAFVGNTAIYRHSASDDEYRHIPASYLIQWEAIKEAKKRGIKFYNFWGVAPANQPHHPWNNITMFKTGFGGSYEYYLPTMDLPLNFMYWKNFVIDWVSAKRKK